MPKMSNTQKKAYSAYLKDKKRRVKAYKSAKRREIIELRRLPL